MQGGEGRGRITLRETQKKTLTLSLRFSPSREVAQSMSGGVGGGAEGRQKAWEEFININTGINRKMFALRPERTCDRARELEPTEDLSKRGGGGGGGWGGAMGIQRKRGVLFPLVRLISLGSCTTFVENP